MTRAFLSDRVVAIRRKKAVAVRAVVTIYDDADALATLWAEPDGGDVVPNPIEADGRFGVWVKPGRYRIVVTAPGFVPTTKYATVGLESAP